MPNVMDTQPKIGGALCWNQIAKIFAPGKIPLGARCPESPENVYTVY